MPIDQDLKPGSRATQANATIRKSLELEGMSGRDIRADAKNRRTSPAYVEGIDAKCFSFARASFSSFPA